ncbi:multicopper oxidase [Pseudomonas syringae pv. actinidiae]|nr:multicopper oxidase [Pseudomonas syringae pv. actinidiae]
MSFTRRQILTGIAGLAVVGLGAGGASRYWMGRRESQAGSDFVLIAAPLDIELVSGHKTPAWAFGGSAPGTELRVRQGEWLRLRFINQLPVETTIHWHGIRLPLEMDGVPYVSQLPVKPGEYFDYKFRVPDAGSYWYHPHVSSSEELGRGLVGPLIVEEREPTGFAHERTVSLKSWHVDEVGAFTEFSVLREAAREGTAGRLSTLNGVPQAVIELPAGQITRVRLLNLDNTVTYRLNLPDAEAQIYALDGNPVTPRPFGDEYWLGPGMRICLAIKLRLRVRKSRYGTARCGWARFVRLPTAMRPVSGHLSCRLIRWPSPIWITPRRSISTSSGSAPCRSTPTTASRRACGRSTAKPGTSPTRPALIVPSPN